MMNCDSMIQPDVFQPFEPDASLGVFEISFLVVDGWVLSRLVLPHAKTTSLKLEDNGSQEMLTLDIIH